MLSSPGSEGSGVRLPARRGCAALAGPLDALYRAYNHAHAARDPVWVARRFERAEDREVAAFCASALAFGRVQSVIRAVERLLAVLGPRPADGVRTFEPGRHRRRLAGAGHRWIRGRDLAALVWILRHMLERAGSIERFFADGHEATAEDVGPALELFSTRALAVDLAPVYGSRGTPGMRSGAAFFFARPSSGSACKRLNLFLRWMVRADAVDLGLWTTVRPAQLVVPLDTHVARVARCLGLTRYRTPGWQMAADITRALRAVDPDDPVRFDFALCHLGMSGACRFGRARVCGPCPLGRVCGRRAGRAGAGHAG